MWVKGSWDSSRSVFCLCRDITTDPVHKQLLNHFTVYGIPKNISLTFLQLPLFDLTLGTEQKVFLDY